MPLSAVSTAPTRRCARRKPSPCTATTSSSRQADREQVTARPQQVIRPSTFRLEQTATDRVTRTLSAWSVSSNATIAVLTALWGLLTSVTSLRVAIAIAGLLILATPFLLPRHEHAPTRRYLVKADFV